MIVSLFIPMVLASAKPGIPSKVDNDGMPTGNKFGRQVTKSSLSMSMAKTATVTWGEDVCFAILSIFFF